MSVVKPEATLLLLLSIACGRYKMCKFSVQERQDLLSRTAHQVPDGGISSRTVHVFDG